MADTATQTLSSFIAAHGITMTVKPTDANPAMDNSRDMDHWKCTLARKVEGYPRTTVAFDAYLNGKCIETVFQSTNDSAEDVKKSLVNHDGYDPAIVVRKRRNAATVRMTLTFSQGLGHHGKEPELSSVLDCLSSDAAGIENAPDFNDWCGEYGFDADSRKAEKTYKACKHQAARLKTFLGDELYDALLWHTERD